MGPRISIAMVVCALLGAGWCAQPSRAGDDADGHDEPKRSALLAYADRLIEQAGDRADAACTWLEQNVSRQKLDAARRAGTHAVDAWFQGMLEDARATRRSAMGLFVIDHQAGPDAPSPAWTRMENPLGSRRAVVLVHGLDEPGGIWDELAPRLDDEGYAVVKFEYANDQAIATSATQLGEALADLREAGVQEVSLVCHSMGGLVARDVLTRPHEGRPLPRADRLITVGTPNHGSPMAPLRALGEMREQFARWIDSGGSDASALLGFLGDGDGMAGEDLLPGSAYLEELNARPLPEGVRITIIAGAIKDVKVQDLDALFRSAIVRKTLGPERSALLKAEAVRAMRALGDGVVTVDSAMLEGVDDTVVVEADHRSMLRTIRLERAARRAIGDTRDEPPAIPIILDRLHRGGDAGGP